MFHLSRFNLAVSRRALTVSLVAVVGVCLGASAQTPENTSRVVPSESVSLEIFKGPQAKKLARPAYPVGERMEANEGWVNLNFMIDPTGKPYEITVSDSTGIRAFEKAAIKAAETWTFEPATLNGVPIDAGHSFKVTFRMTDPDKGASDDFVKAYRKTIRAVGEKDRAAADAAIKRMNVTNLYEDAFFNVARYTYFQEWGDQAQQIDALERAVAHEGTATYLPEPTFEAALVALMKLKFDAHHFAGVLKIWRDVQKTEIDKEQLARWQPVIDDLEKLKTDNRSYSVDGAFGDSSSWSYTLHKKNFRIEVASGRIAEIKLRCEKKYVFFKFDPTLQYSTNKQFGSCGMELIGDPKTQFTLIQS